MIETAKWCRIPSAARKEATRSRLRAGKYRAVGKLELNGNWNWMETRTIWKLELYGNWNYMETGTGWKLELDCDWNYTETGTIRTLELYGNWNCRMSLSQPAYTYANIGHDRAAFQFEGHWVHDGCLPVETLPSMIS